uniref:Uncharacterized protein n=1 Tax=Anguilla anguilla TaxID=7936 RepID=A0A0E9WNK7_ANGAN
MERAEYWKGGALENKFLEKECVSSPHLCGNDQTMHQYNFHETRESVFQPQCLGHCKLLLEHYCMKWAPADPTLPRSTMTELIP